MSNFFNFDIEWIDIEDPIPLEGEKTYGLLKIQVNEFIFTKNINCDTNKQEDSILVSAYPLAEWLVDNWWRITSEHKDNRPTNYWDSAHNLSYSCWGFDWPLLTIWSNKDMVNFEQVLKDDNRIRSIIYTTKGSTQIPLDIFEAESFKFVEKVLNRLKEKRIYGTNLEKDWPFLLEENKNDDIKDYMKREAAYGFNPSEGSWNDRGGMSKEKEERV